MTDPVALAAVLAVLVVLASIAFAVACVGLLVRDVYRRIRARA